MNKIILVFLLLATIKVYALLPHPVHLSVTNVEYNQKNKSFEISIRLFVDDFDKILSIKNHTAVNLGKPNENPQANQFITNYITSHLIFFFNGKKIDKRKFVLKKREIKDITIWLYYKIKYPQQLKTVQIQNTLMTDLYGDQKNLLIFTYKETQKALEFNSKKILHSFQL